MVHYKSFEFFDLAVCLDTVSIVRRSILLEVYRVDEVTYQFLAQGEYNVQSASTAPLVKLDYGSENPAHISTIGAVSNHSVLKITLAEKLGESLP